MLITNSLHQAKISLWDQISLKPLDDSVVYQFLRYVDGDITEEDFLTVPDMLRFAQQIRDFKESELRNEETALEFYQQHKKTIDKDKEKQKTFCLMFGVRDFEQLKQKLSYPDEFYDEDLRKSLLEEQEYRCGLCNKRMYPEFTEPDLHHIDYNKRNCSRDNLVFLCARCHGKTNSKRQFWQNVLVERKVGGFK